ncbi:preprotein translocase subunit SecG [bacterium CG2_30_37_16]|nr:MAG: preprotein translocase subunit SecG [bacterium CG2_30_37_16]PIP30829.1 MAG: preprotein translocase subunit SecG [bacterium (Candidatus Howlettbacteria) CG23_combo_of_CG06-09_8_20_14_all_37_9]PIX99562.1 MAG: preprotein translocase subunit SecG [bacterium (Candidatus Howlettbacteria) CG_4_10_14_3_um_filter_37_10]PJB06105.1 MAG: preprotein translocase subunit SecG [bacterium (Candidatus Howlettbacteria) CG_4_9_14_3_um_filter_37_10]
MKIFINVLIWVSGSLLIMAILLQSKGSGLGAAFGGTSNIYKVKRGAEKFLFYLTIVMAIVFCGSLFSLIFI